MNGAETLLLIWRVALRNLWLYRFKTIVVAALLGFGAFLAVVGLSLLRDIEASMTESITGSVAGHLQVYSAKAKDDLALFGGGFMGRSDIGVLSDLAPYRALALSHPNVEAFVPQGIDTAYLGRGNVMDDTIDALRAALKKQDPVIIDSRLEQLTFQMSQLQLEIAASRKLLADKGEADRQRADLDRASAVPFLARLRQGDEEALQFLETRIAPASGSKSPIYLMYLGTDITMFAQHFPKLKILAGEALPAGKRGILISSKVRDDYLKNQVARLFDRIHKRLTKSGQTIAASPDSTREARDLPKQYTQILTFLDRQEAAELAAKLKALGLEGSEAGDLLAQLSEQLRLFLQVNDQNFLARYQWFYEHIAPKIKLYEIEAGDTIILRSYTRSGYVKSLPLKVYGIYSFNGLEDSDLAGVMNIIDLVSFRELYGQMTAAAKAELAELKQQAGLQDVTAENAEAALFGADRSVVLEAQGAPASGGVSTIKVTPVVSEEFNPDELASGLCLNAAVILKDPSQLATTARELSEQFTAKGLDVRVVDWQQASGIVGQFVNIVRLALIFALAVIFIVALVIINNSIIVSTMHRTREIGMMRAIGAQKSFVMGLFLAETAITAFLGAVVGSCLAALALGLLGRSGIPATSDVMTFLFSGPRLYPAINPDLMVGCPLFVAVVATLCSTYAARHAAYITPAEAMQEKE